MHWSQRVRHILGATAVAAAVACVLAMVPGVAQAVPIRGNTGWSVLMCKFKDQAAEPKDAQFFRDFLTDAGAGKGGVADYFADQSGGRITLAGSVVRGWFDMPFTLKEEKAKGRGTQIQDCVDAADKAGFKVPAGHRTIVVTNANGDGGSSNGRVILNPKTWNVAFAAHEMLHGYGLGHSYSDDTSYQNASWSKPGEYDDMWDEMSAMHIYSFNTANFGNGAVGLNGYHRDKLGWLPRSRVSTFGADGVGARTMTLAPLEVAGAPGPQLVRIPFDPSDLFHYYTVEFRKKVFWSAGIPRDIVLIHEVRNGTSYLLRTAKASDATRAPVQSLNANGVSISVGAINGTAATVTIKSDIVERCLQGYVWRSAQSGDKVCVTPQVRSDVRADNAAASSRWVNGPFGPHTCVQGYVWRSAFSGDDVCVVPPRRDQARADNAAADSRRNPARLVFGPNTCKAGYVWRGVDDADYVCVTPQVRTQVRADNDAASSRWVNGSFGPHTCVQGYVWRSAFPGDDVCVVPAQRTQARDDNAEAPNRVERP